MPVDDLEVHSPRRLRFLKWENDVRVGRTVYTFTGMTKESVARQAFTFVKGLKR